MALTDTTKKFIDSVKEPQFSLPLPKEGEEFLARSDKPKLWGFDTETYYDDHYSVRDAGVDCYVEDPRFDCHMVSFYGPHGEWAGHPKDCDWEKYNGGIWVSHNSRFDRAVFRRCKVLGIIPEHIEPSEWHCSANLSVYLQAPRNLEGASRELLGEVPDKNVRASMKGGMTPMETLLFGQDPEVLKYALEDARLCAALFTKYADKWPMIERQISALTIEQGEYGVRVDMPGIDAGIHKLEARLVVIVDQLPWKATHKPSSTKALRLECAKANIPPPPSTAEGDPEYEEWEDQYGMTIPFVSAIREWRKTNRLLQVLKAMKQRTRGEDDIMSFNLKYFGAIATGRWSGDAGLNMQNFPRQGMHGIDPRNLIIPRKDHKFIIADLSQIEPRCLAWMVGDWELLDAIRGGLPIYEAHARSSMGWEGGSLKKEDPLKYLLAKCRVLGLGYGAGGTTFKHLAKAYGLKITHQEANATVKSFRNDNPKIVNYWYHMEELMKEAEGNTFFVQLPSGRFIRYFDVEVHQGSEHSKIRAATERGGYKFHWYGGKLVENLIQAVARDVFAEGMLRLHQAGIRVIWSVHDEVICEVHNDSGVTPDMVCGLLAQAPQWMPGLPVEAEAEETQFYCK